jgi:hypothetical protein
MSNCQYCATHSLFSRLYFTRFELRGLYDLQCVYKVCIFLSRSRLNSNSKLVDHTFFTWGPRFCLLVCL